MYPMLWMAILRLTTKQYYELSSQRFLDDNEPRDAIHRLYDEDSSFILGDPTDIERPQAKKTEYVGQPKDKKLGF